jgi:hypothetical protein
MKGLPAKDVEIHVWGMAATSLSSILSKLGLDRL